MERAIAAGFLTEWSAVALSGVLNVLPNLVLLLQDQQAKLIFSRSCAIAHILSRQLPTLQVFMRGIQAMAVSLHLSLPLQAEPSFQNLTECSDVADVPTAYQLPRFQDVGKLLTDEDMDSTSMGVELSLMIAKWSAMSTI